MKEFNNINPWLGLRTYSENSESEGHYLYGRAGEIDSLSRDISYNRQTVVYGKSGIGKSSLLNAGVFPRLRKANMFPVNVRLVHKGEGSTYSSQISAAVEESLYHLRREIINEDGKVAIIKDLRGRKVETCPPVNADGTETLWEYFHRHRFFDEQDNEIVPILVIDQFEEIFTLCKDETKKLSFFSELADLINDVPPAYIYNIQETQDKNNVVEELTIDGNEDLILSEDEDSENNNQSKYVNDPQFHLVITLREDFLSYLERYTTNIPLLKHNRYCLNPLSDDQAAEIILDPVPGLISKDVAIDIICKVANAKRSDFVLGDGVAQIEVDSAILSLFLSELFVHRSNTDSIISKELVESIGDNIIKSFYERTISKISEKSALFLEKELITDDGEFARRDSIFESVAIKNGVTAEELNYLKEERLIHEYPWNNEIRIEFIHDILCPVVKERKEKREQLRKQEEERKRQEEEKQKAIAEEKRKREESERKAAEEKAELEAETKRVKLRNRKRLSILTAIIVFLCVSMGVIYSALFAEYSVCYGNFTTKFGWPIGLGDKLDSQQDKDNCTVYYRLSRDGWLPSFSIFGIKHDAPFTKVEIINWKGDNTTNVFVDSPVVRIIDKELDNTKAASFANLQERVSYWIFAPDDNGAISRKTAYSIDKKELYSEVYSVSNSTDNNSKYVMWSVFKDKDGSQLQISDNGTDRIRYTVSNGAITGCSFFTELGTPQPNTSGDYGYSYETDSVTTFVSSQMTLDKFGDKVPNTETKYSSYLYGRYTQANNVKLTYAKQQVIFRTLQFVDTIHISEKGTVDKAHLHIKRENMSMINFVYDSQNRIKSKQCYLKDDLIYNATYWYSSRLDSVKVYNRNESPCYYTEKYRYPKENIKEVSFWYNGQSIMRKVAEGIDTITYHKKLVVETGKVGRDTITTCYLDLNNVLTSVGEYAKSVIIREKRTNNILYEYYYNKDDDIYKSEMYTYNEYGIRESRSVAGIDGTPVRCPNWDWDKNIFYKMKFLKVDYLDRAYVAVKSIDELGDNTAIIAANNYEINWIETPLTDVYEENGNSFVHGVAISQIKIIRQSGESRRFPFIHILNRQGTFYNSSSKQNSHISTRLHDGDIIIKINGKQAANQYGCQEEIIDTEIKQLTKHGGDVTILRMTNRSFKRYDIVVNKGNIGAEYHVCPISNAMYNTIKQELSHE